MSIPELPPLFTVLFMSVWLVFFILGREQFKRIKANTLQITLDGIEAALAKNKELSVSQYYKQVNRQWEAMVPKTAKFVLHRSELYPVPIKLEDLRKRLNFSPEWIGAFLLTKGYTLKATPDQQERIKYIASYAKVLFS